MLDENDDNRAHIVPGIGVQIDVQAVGFNVHLSVHR